MNHTEIEYPKFVNLVRLLGKRRRIYFGSSVGMAAYPLLLYAVTTQSSVNCEAQLYATRKTKTGKLKASLIIDAIEVGSF